MKKIVLTTATFLFASGMAFAGSDNFGSNGANQAAPAVDGSYTASVQKSAHADKQPIVQGSDRNLFGNN